MLKLLFAAFLRALLIYLLSITPSVTINDSMVPIFGAIIPLPFVIPAIFTFSPLVNVTSNAHCFGILSVVIMAFAAANESSDLFPRLENTLEATPVITSRGILRPITPVEEIAISPLGIFSSLETSSTNDSQSSIP